MQGTSCRARLPVKPAKAGASPSALGPELGYTRKEQASHGYQPAMAYQVTVRLGIFYPGWTRLQGKEEKVPQAESPKDAFTHKQQEAILRTQHPHSQRGDMGLVTYICINKYGLYIVHKPIKDDFLMTFEQCLLQAQEKYVRYYNAGICAVAGTCRLGQIVLAAHGACGRGSVEAIWV
ncbi:hypothetical protein STEG23_017550 [Scotinomys teguina]